MLEDRGKWKQKELFSLEICHCLWIYRYCCCQEMNVYEASSMTRDSSRCGERRRRCPPGLTEERRAWVSQGGEEGRWLHCSWSWACWVHLAPWPDGKEAVPRDLITRGEMLRCELPNYESPGHTCSLEAHQCYRYWKIILAANFKLRRVPSGLQM